MLSHFLLKKPKNSSANKVRSHRQNLSSSHQGILHHIVPQETTITMINSFFIALLVVVALQVHTVYSKEGSVRGLATTNSPFCPVSSPIAYPPLACRLPEGQDTLTCGYSHVLNAAKKPNGSCKGDPECVPTEECSCVDGYWSCIAFLLDLCANTSPVKVSYEGVGAFCTP
jgi:hypothetical protein